MIEKVCVFQFENLNLHRERAGVGEFQCRNRRRSAGRGSGTRQELDLCRHRYFRQPIAPSYAIAADHITNTST